MLKFRENKRKRVRERGRERKRESEREGESETEKDKQSMNTELCSVVVGNKSVKQHANIKKSYAEQFEFGWFVSNGKTKLE